jgi:glycosyltransferase involved in cell wall biosynthesis
MKKILFTIGVYFPYENGGGMATSVKNLLAKLKNEFEIYVLTKQQTKSEQNDKIAFVNTWLKIDQVFYYYASAKQLKTTNLRVLINKLSPSVIYCSSFFEPITIRINLLFRLKLIDSKKLVVAPRGELGAKALTKRRLKKQLYLNCYNAVQMFRTVHFHVTCESEQCSLKEAINAHPSFIHKISNYGSNPISYQKLRKRFINERKLRSGRLKIAFISRIEEQKNLLFAIKVVIKADIQVLFDIYGEINDLKYFEKCKKLMNSNNKIQIHYKKSLNSNQVRDTLLKYDLLFYPLMAKITVTSLQNL